MSAPSGDEAQEAFFEDYKLWAAENNIPATLDGFDVWLSDSDLEVSYE